MPVRHQIKPQVSDLPDYQTTSPSIASLRLKVLLRSNSNAYC